LKGSNSGQAAAVPGYCLGFEAILPFYPSLNMGGVIGKHIPGKLAYGYLLSLGAPGAGFCVGFLLGVAGGEFFREMMQVPAIPVFAHIVRKPAGRVKGEPERFGICPANDGKRFGGFGHSTLFFFKRIKAR
jgi:hypothetical protein